MGPQPPEEFRFGVDPSLPGAASSRGLARLTRVLSGLLGRAVDVSVAPDEAALSAALLRGWLQAAWAPPYACARTEANGGRVLARAVRSGTSRVRAFLVARADAALTAESLAGTSVAWVDRTSLAGYLLPCAHLRARAGNPDRLFFRQEFVGSERAALDALLAGEVDVAAVSSPVDAADPLAGIERIAPGQGRELAALCDTGVAPTDGMVLAAASHPADAIRLERGLLDLARVPEGIALMREVLTVERLEPAGLLEYRTVFESGLRAA